MPRAYGGIVSLRPADATGVDLLTALAAKDDELADALRERGVDVATFLETHLRPGPRRAFRRSGSRQLQRVLVEAGDGVFKDGRSVILRVDFIRALAAQLTIDAELADVGIRAHDLEEIAADLSR